MKMFAAEVARGNGRLGKQIKDKAMGHGFFGKVIDRESDG